MLGRYFLWSISQIFTVTLWNKGSQKCSDLPTVNNRYVRRDRTSFSDRPERNSRPVLVIRKEVPEYLPVSRFVTLGNKLGLGFWGFFVCLLSLYIVHHPYLAELWRNWLYQRRQLGLTIYNRHSKHGSFAVIKTTTFLGKSFCWMFTDYVILLGLNLLLQFWLQKISSQEDVCTNHGWVLIKKVTWNVYILSSSG